MKAHAVGGEYVEPFAIWWPSLSGDAGYDPALCLVAVDGQGDVLGVAQCGTGGFVKDLAVDPAHRRKGLASALLHEAFRAFRERGAPFVELKVRPDNPSGALRLYRSLGFRDVESYRSDEGFSAIPKACSRAGLPSRSTR